MTNNLDRFLSAEIRAAIEKRYYAHINRNAQFENLARDGDFMRQLNDHVGLYSDHGVVHVRDVATQLLTVLNTCHGLLIAPREPDRFRRMQGYGILLAYLHDIGMINSSAFGRFMHAEYAAQAIFDPATGDIFDSIWHENSANLAWHLTQLADQSLLPGNPRTVLREMLSLAFCHSKSKCPAIALANPPLLRTMAQEVIGTNLDALYLIQQLRRAEQGISTDNESKHGAAGRIAQARAELNAFDGSKNNRHVEPYYDRINEDAYRWLESPTAQLRMLVHDVTDTLRALRCADAMRQRGRILKTSGQYEIIVDSRSANAIYALQWGTEHRFLLEAEDRISAGEANIGSSELDQQGNLRITLQHGRFSAPGATEHAIDCAVTVIQDIRQDVIESFRHHSAESSFPGMKSADEMCILIEEVEDNPDFARQVKRGLLASAMSGANEVRVVPSLQLSSEPERVRYLTAADLTWTMRTRQDLLDRVARSGHPASGIDRTQAFAHVKLMALQAGEILFVAGTHPSFAYIPLNPGLDIFSSGGYQSTPAPPWMPIGVTDIISGTARGTTVIANAALHLVAIPASAFVRHWHQTHTHESFRQTVSMILSADASAAAGAMTQLEKVLLLQSVPIFSVLDADALANLANIVQETLLPAGTTLFEKGDPGDEIFVVAEGELEVHNSGEMLSILRVGDNFGEIAALTSELRTASVRSTSDSRLLSLKRTDLLELFTTNSSVARAVVDALATYIREHRKSNEALSS